MAERFVAVRRSLGEELFQRISACKVLVVGAGGIGCELIKSLVMTGFANIHVIDLDTIDVSNLNRQFLFRPHHVGMSKAEVAKEAALQFNPRANITAYHGNIKSHDFGVDFFRQFDLVMNALDNVGARRHVNRLCLACDLPLVESGTTGYLGQAMVIKKGETECYECTPKPSQKVYPICTIRSTPDKPVHCVVYAKEVYKLLFGQMAESMLFEDTSNGATSVYMDAVQLPFAVTEDVNASHYDSLVQYAAEVLAGLYIRDVENKIAMGTYKGATKAPEPLSDADLQAGIELARRSLREPGVRPSFTKGWERTRWGPSECVAEFILCIVDMWTQPKLRVNMGAHAFDKDDRVAMKFVCAASNLRSYVFSIDAQSYHDCKGIAGNIIPAIATTNAIVAGLQVLEAIKILRADRPIKEACKYTYCLRNPTRKGLYLQPVKLADPSPSCFVCGVSQLTVQVNTETTTLRDFVDQVLRQRLAFNEPTIMSGANLLYEEGEDADEDLAENLPKTLAALPAGGLRDGSMLTVQDFSQELNVNILIAHRTEFDEETEGEGFVISGNIPTAQASAPSAEQPMAVASAAEAAAPAASENDGDDFIVIGTVVAGEEPPKTAAKRQREKLGDNSTGSLKKKRGSNGTDAVGEEVFIVD